MFKILCLFTGPFCHSSCISLSVIVDSWALILLSKREEFNGWIASYSKFTSSLFMFSGINFANFHLSFQICGKFCILWSQRFAMSAPWSIELHKPCAFISIDTIFEVTVCEDDHIFLIKTCIGIMTMSTSTSAWASSQSFISNLYHKILTFLNFLSMKSTMPSAVLGPSYSETLPSTNSLMVGNPWTWISVFSADPSIAAMLAIPAKALAAF